MTAIKLTQLDYDLLDIVFEMGNGYVLDFSDRKFSQFFNEELNIDIDSPMYRDVGNSKAKRLRSFWAKSNKNENLRVIVALWDYREKKRIRSGGTPMENHYLEELQELLEKLGTKPKPYRNTGDLSEVDSGITVSSDIRQKLIAELTQLSTQPPQPRGYAF